MRILDIVLPAETPAATANGITSEARQDGRRASRLRNRDAVVEALFACYLEGNFRPNAQEIAERSGVSRRSVFRYFDDLEDLQRSAIVLHFARVAHLVALPGDLDAPLCTRVEQISEHRARLYHAITPVSRVSRLNAPFVPFVADRLKIGASFLSWQVELQFRNELGSLPSDERAELLGAADAVCSFEFFEHLTVSRGLTPVQIKAIVSRTLSALFASAVAGER